MIVSYSGGAVHVQLRKVHIVHHSLADGRGVAQSEAETASSLQSGQQVEEMLDDPEELCILDESMVRPGLTSHGTADKGRNDKGNESVSACASETSAMMRGGAGVDKGENTSRKDGPAHVQSGMSLTCFRCLFTLLTLVYAQEKS